MSQELDLNVNLLRSILWQYENADKLKALVIGQQEWINENHTKFWNDWIRDVFNLSSDAFRARNLVWRRLPSCANTAQFDKCGDCMSQELDLNVNLLRSILWQYENADKLKALVIGQQEWINENHTKFWNDWIRDVFNLKTANAFGLAVWSSDVYALDIDQVARTQRSSISVVIV